MINAWSLAASILDGTFDEDYPIMKKKEIEHSDYYYDYTRNDSNAENPFTDFVDRARAERVVSNTDQESEIETYPIREDIPEDLWGKPIIKPNNTVYKPQKNHQYKYHEEEILKDIEEYVSSTYQGHYTGTKHEFRKVQTIDLMAARDIAAQFCQANILKYGSRYGSKDGRNKKDLLKVIHYAMLLAHFDGHYGEPSMPSGNFDQMP